MSRGQGSEDVVHLDVFVEEIDLDKGTMSTHNYTLNMTNGVHEPTEEELRHSVMIFYIVLFVMIGAQSALVRWRKAHRRSYELVTLIGLWLVPPVISVQLLYWRFILIWSLYSIATGVVFYKAIESKSIDKMVPKQVYRWFIGAFRTSVGVGVTGYGLLLLEIFGAGMMAGPLFDPGFAIILIWYGLYFGILTRDCAEVASDRMAARLGAGRKMAVSVRDCALCGGELRDGMSHLGNENLENTEKSVQLSCKHIFHPDCIRGWLIVGKKDSCPACNEKVDLRKLYANKPWETRNLSWIQMLDLVRYMVVWQPTIMTGLHIIFHIFHMDEDFSDHEHRMDRNDTSANMSTLA